MSDLINNHTLDFEKPVRDLENQIKELKQASDHRPEIDLSEEVKGLQKKIDVLLKDIYKNLTPWERVQLSRHPNRPHAVDYIENVFEDFHEICGDRFFANDEAIITGIAKLNDKPVAVIGIEKGRKTKEKVQHNFGMPRPEGYRKALRVMELASRFNIPVVTLVDTPGAYPGIGAEERGQASAIAENLAAMFDIKSPMISIVIGEGGSGGALGIAVTDRVLILEYSVYSVISPESCASILWADPSNAEKAANSLKLDPKTALELKVVDKVVSEPIGGAHRDHQGAYDLLKKAISKELKELESVDVDKLLEKRFKKFREMGNQTLTQ